MSDIFRSIIIMSLSGSTVAGLLFALKPFVRNRLPKSTQYYLWVVVIIALLVPVSTFIKLPTTADVQAILTPSNVVERYVISADEEKTRLSLNMAKYRNAEKEEYIRKVNEIQSPISSKVTIFMLVYPLGAFIVLLYYIINYYDFIKLYRRTNTEVNAEELALLAKLCKNRNVPKLYCNQLAATPMLIGVLRPAIILPQREYTNEKLHSVFLHELTHLRRKDILVKWLSVFATVLHWFNPIVWLARHELERTCELSCDEAVIRNFDKDGKQVYGETLIYIAANSKTLSAVVSTSMSEDKKVLKERLGAIMSSQNSTRCTIIASLFLIVAIGGTAIMLGAGRVIPPPDSIIEKEIKPTITLYDFDQNKDNGDTDEIEKHFTRLQPNADTDVTVLTDMIFIDVISPKGSVSLRTYYAETNGTACLMGDYKWSSPDQQSPVSFFNPSEKNTFSAKNIYPDGFTGSIWAVTTDAEGVEHTSDVINVFYEPERNLTEIEPNNAVEMLLKTIDVSNGAMLFKLPEGVAADKWSIIIAGRAETNGFSRSVHLFDNEKWVSGKQYEIKIAEQGYTELLMEISLPEATSQTIDLLDIYRSYNRLSTSSLPMQQMPEFSESEVADAKAVVELYYNAQSEKDLESYAALWQRELVNFKLQDDVTITLVEIRYASQDSMRRSYTVSGMGSVDGTTVENVIVFKCDFNVHYKDGIATGAWNEGDYYDWSVILVREDSSKPWLIADHGY